MKELRAGLVGLGSMGRNHARVLLGLPGVRLVAIADPACSQSTFQGCPVFPTLDEMLKVGIDYAVVASPTTTHCRVVNRLADSEIPALVEKPLAGTESEALEMTESFRSKGLLGGVGHIERFNAANQEARRRILAGELGQIYQVASRRLSHFPQRVADVGVGMDLASHDVDTTAWLCSSNYAWISAAITSLSPDSREDLIAASAVLENGVVVSHVVNWLSPFKERSMVITGEYGAFVIDTLHSDLTFYENGSTQAEWDLLASFRGATEGSVTRYAFAKPEPLRTEHEHFRNAVLGQAHDIVSFSSGLETVRTVTQMLKQGQMNCHSNRGRNEGKSVQGHSVLESHAPR